MDLFQLIYILEYNTVLSTNMFQDLLHTKTHVSYKNIKVWLNDHRWGVEKYFCKTIFHALLIILQFLLLYEKI
jgi:hypothetical protein